MFGLPHNHKDKYGLAILNIILGGNMSSRLFNELREKRGLAYSIGSSAKPFYDTGLFLIRAGVDNRKLTDAVALILGELKKMKQTPVTKGELTRAKEFLTGQILLDLEDTLEHMLWIGSSTMILNRIRTLPEILRAVRKVATADIQRLAQRIFQGQHYNLAIVGPITGEQDKQLRRLLGVR
jgi:predicted Zn-dependent peptidase